jgi:hypothetical protein
VGGCGKGRSMRERRIETGVVRGGRGKRSACWESDVYGGLGV